MEKKNKLRNMRRYLLSCLEPFCRLLVFIIGWIGLIHARRLLSSILVWIPVFLYLYPGTRRKLVLWTFAWALFFASSIAPFDITFINYPGPPRFVKVITGLPSCEGYGLLLRYEAVWRGCIRHGNEPEWVWVW